MEIRHVAPQTDHEAASQLQAVVAMLPLFAWAVHWENYWKKEE